MTATATLYFDGCSKGNPGPSGSGALIKHENIIWRDFEYVGNTTNNVILNILFIFEYKSCRSFHTSC